MQDCNKTRTVALSHASCTAAPAFRSVCTVLVALTLAVAASSAMAHGTAEHAKAGATMPISDEVHAFGRQGDPKKVVRTIRIDMTDAMRFTPSEITVRQGETVRFVVTNRGGMMHELVLGRRAELVEHGELMKKHPDMEHDEPYMSHVAPGKQEDLVWQFTQAGEFYYGCLLPGHFEAGMVGKVKVGKPASVTRAGKGKEG